MRASEENPLQADDLSRPDDRTILVHWRTWLQQGGAPNARGAFYDTLDERLQERVDRLLQTREEQTPIPQELLRAQVLDAIARLRLRNLRQRNREIRFLQDDAQASGDREMLRSYLKSSVEVTGRIRRLEQAISNRSISGRRQSEDIAVRVAFAEE
jgi:hypothetical protein